MPRATPLSMQQHEMLLGWFTQNIQFPYPTCEVKRELASQMVRSSSSLASRLLVRQAEKRRNYQCTERIVRASRELVLEHAPALQEFTSRFLGDLERAKGGFPVPILRQSGDRKPR
jgi:hypothetical protein